ncbi:type II secretion system F family protein [Kineococcus rhizosphaerae]|uniref:Type II secretion system (T2SS) protein F n=1 Tax=Kineococcus rhizosphaerae TaxID=559628 RepID=A0A2T0R5N8_9ACTN|nr:type II secretion system F family protein [Kineococcus rhizosphaerae]PRY16083.1 type II secretion system (T2SS) protein F [Kineococcus rhizosphaerae]
MSAGVGAGVGVGVLLGAAVLVAGGVRARSARPARRRVRLRRRDPGGPPAPDVALVCDLVAAAVGAGLPPGRALEAALDALAAEGFAEDAVLRRAAVRLSWGADPAEFAEVLAGHGTWDDLAEPLLLSARTGAPAATLLASAATSRRARRRWEAEAAAGRLAARLVLPLGLCTLPAFLLLGVVPVVLTLAGQVLS